jgi:hypothetical protein
VSSKSREIGRKILLELSERLHSIANDPHTSAAAAQKAMKDLLLLVLTFLAVGRSGEVGLSSWKASYWCHEARCFVLQWPELKTGEGRHEQYPNAFFHCLMFTFSLSNVYRQRS